MSRSGRKRQTEKARDGKDHLTARTSYNAEGQRNKKSVRAEIRCVKTQQMPTLCADIGGRDGHSRPELLLKRKSVVMSHRSRKVARWNGHSKSADRRKYSAARRQRVDEID